MPRVRRSKQVNISKGREELSTAMQPACKALSQNNVGGDDRARIAEPESASLCRPPRRRSSRCSPRKPSRSARPCHLCRHHRPELLLHPAAVNTTAPPPAAAPAPATQSPPPPASSPPPMAPSPPPPQAANGSAAGNANGVTKSSSGSSFPTWAIGVIVAAVVLVLLGVLGE